MTRKNIVLLSLITLLFYACNNSKPEEYVDIANSLSTAIKMLPIETTVYLDDYIDESFIIDSIIGHEALEIQNIQEKRQLILKEKGDLPPISSIEIIHPAGRTEIPLLKTKKQKIKFSFDPGDIKVKHVGIAGEMNAWNPQSTPLEVKDGKWTTTFYLIPGQYGYQMELDGVRAMDHNNPNQITNGMGGFNSVMNVEGTPQNRIPSITLRSFEGNTIKFSTLNADEVIAFWNNELIPASKHQGHFDLAIPDKAKSFERSFIRIWAFNDIAASKNALVPLEFGEVINNPEMLDRTDPQLNVMYNVFIDRFHNGNPDNDNPIQDERIHPRANYHGGDLEGLEQKIEEGYFDKLGVNNLWLSPVVKNPEEAYGNYDQNGIKSKFAGYHGYWPISFTKLNPHFGNEEDLKKLVEKGHERGYNMFLDFVANHVHENHPVYQANKDNGWATNLYLEDGSLNTERWDDQRLTTWFDIFLPTLNLEKQEITEMLSDSALYWLENYEFDGFRHDATKHIPENFWRTLTKKVRKYEDSTGNTIIQLGETYGTPELISSYISSGMLDAQFDFNVYDALSSSIASDDISLKHAAKRIEQSIEYYGPNHIMGNISGNQDRARFMSHSSGDVSLNEDTKYAGWSRKINTKTKKAYKKQALLMAVNMTIPGIPVIYYGDEIGMTGANDPDNRRMMYFENWNENEIELFENIRKCIEIRKNEMPLLYGDFHFLSKEDDHLIYARKYFDQSVIVLINNSEESKKVIIPLPQDLNVENITNNFDTQFEIDRQGNLIIDLPALSFEILNN